MTPGDLIAAFDVIAEAPDGVERLREIVLRLAVQGKLVGHDLPEGVVDPSIQPIGSDEPDFEIPASWQWLRFPEVATYVVGKTPSTRDSRYWGDDEIPWVSIGDMPDGGVVTATRRTVSQLAADEVFRRTMVPAGTLLMRFKLTIGKVAVLGVDAYHNEAIISVRPNKLATRDFLFRALPLFAAGAGTKAAIKGATLNGDSLARMRIPVPPVAEQSTASSPAWTSSWRSATPRRSRRPGHGSRKTYTSSSSTWTTSQSPHGRPNERMVAEGRRTPHQRQDAQTERDHEGLLR